MAVRWSEAQLREFEARRRGETPNPRPPAASVVRGSAERMNKTERRYLIERIEPRCAMGEVLDWEFEALTFTLGYRCRYTPDFLLRTPEGLEIVEVKGGYIREDALVKFKATADRFRGFAWFLAQWKGGAWTVRRY